MNQIRRSFLACKKRIVIVGGVAGGASAAARARRLSEEAEILLIERGEHISFANCGLPYHIGGQIQDRNRLLVQTPASMKARFAIDVRIRSEVTQIDPKAKTVTIMDLSGGYKTYCAVAGHLNERSPRASETGRQSDEKDDMTMEANAIEM